MVFDEYWKVKPRPQSAAREMRKLLEGKGLGKAAQARAKAAAARAAREAAETAARQKQENAGRGEKETSQNVHDRYPAPPGWTHPVPPERPPVPPAFEARRPSVPSTSYSGRPPSLIPGSSYQRPGRRFVSGGGNNNNAGDTFDPPKLGTNSPRLQTPPSPPVSLEPSRRRVSPTGFEASRVPYGQVVGRKTTTPAGSNASEGNAYSRNAYASYASSSNASEYSQQQLRARQTQETCAKFVPHKNTYASFVRSVRTFGVDRGGDNRSCDAETDERNRISISGVSSRVASNVSSRVNSSQGVGGFEWDENGRHVSVSHNRNPKAPRGEYGTLKPPPPGYYRARVFNDVAKAPTYHFQSGSAPWLKPEVGQLRRYDQTGRLGDQKVTSGTYLGNVSFRRPGRFESLPIRASADPFDARDSYGASQSTFLKTRTAFELAEAVRRGDTHSRFGGVRALPNDLERRRHDYPGAYHSRSTNSQFETGLGATERKGNTSSSTHRLGPLYGNARFGVGALEHRARVSNSLGRFESELIDVGRRSIVSLENAVTGRGGGEDGRGGGGGGGGGGEGGGGGGGGGRR